jgi:HEAT repeat protein
VIALIPQLESSKADIKRETITQLQNIGDRRAVIPLVAKFGDSSPPIRVAAIKAVGELKDPAAVPALIRLIGDPTEEVRNEAVKALGNIAATEAIDALIEQLNAGTDTYKENVALALGKIAGKPGGAAKGGDDALRALVASIAQPKLRKGATEGLKYAGTQAVPALVAHLLGKIPGDPTTAVTLLADAADARATAALTAELERGRVATPLVLKALGATRDPAALVPVLGMLSNKDPAIRLAAMDALRPLLGNDARAGDVLVEHLADDDLEVRILAAEYLGILRVGAATPKLIALSGAGNPPRLRRAAIDALGEIRRPEATKALLDVLREGPTDLHRAAATALSYVADPSAIPALILDIRSDHGPMRHEVVRALGATMRTKSDPAGRALLRELAEDGNVKVSVAAIDGLAATNDPADLPFLRALVDKGAADRRRAAAWAVGEMHDTGAIEGLATAMASNDDRLAGDAAWALGEIFAASPRDGHVGAMVDRWLHLAKHGHWASAIDGVAALSRTLWALPKEGRAQLVGGTRRAALTALASHKSRLVRINVAHALAAIGDDDAVKTLGQLIHDDANPRVRAAAAVALAQVGSPKAAAALKAGVDYWRDATLADAAKATAIPPRNEWRSFYVVDPSVDDAPVRQEPYFVQSGDGLVWATYTDARGHLTSEHVPAGDMVVWSGAREAEY